MKKFTAVFFLCTIISFMFFIPVSFALNRINRLKAQNETKADSSIIDWEKLYPFDENAPVKEYRDKETLYAYIKGRCELYTSKFVLGRMTLTETAKLYENIIGWNLANIFEYNGVVEIRGDYLSRFYEKYDITKAARGLIDFERFCRESGADFLYCNHPVKTCIYEDWEITGKLDFSNQNADEFLAMLTEAGVNYHDFRKILHEDGKNHHEAFYRTDHHWKAETGLWAAGHILKFLKDDYGWNVNPEILNPGNFDYVVYPEWFLGSLGRKFTLARTRPEDFTLIYPRFRTLLHYEIPDIGLDTSGDFSITYNMDAVAEKDYYDKNPYTAYDYSDHPVMRTHNYLNDDGKKILFIHDSFSNTVIPFVALAVQDVEEVDLRHFHASVRRYVQESRPDLVVVIYDSSEATDWDENKHNGMYDFR